jgi:hypothetical protein
VTCGLALGVWRSEYDAFGGHATADDAGLRADESAVLLVAQTDGLHNRALASDGCRCRSGRASHDRRGLTAPDFERLARTPWPHTSLASSGIKALSSDFARSWSRKADRVAQKRPANSPTNWTRSCQLCELLRSAAEERGGARDRVRMAPAEAGLVGAAHDVRDTGYRARPAR